jgi:PleD family two-component response regulator
VDASIGVVEIDPGEGLAAAAWLARADAGCYQAKRAGRGGVRLVAAPVALAEAS